MLLVAAIVVVDAAVAVVVVVLAAVVAGAVRASPCRPARPLGDAEVEAVRGCCCGCCRRFRGAAAVVDAAARTMLASTRGADQASCPASSNSG